MADKKTPNLDAAQDREDALKYRRRQKQLDAMTPEERKYRTKLESVQFGSGGASWNDITQFDKVIGVLHNHSNSMVTLEGVPTPKKNDSSGGLHEHGYKHSERDFLIMGPGEYHPVTQGMALSGCPRETGPNGCVKLINYDPEKHRPSRDESYDRSNVQRGDDKPSYEPKNPKHGAVYGDSTKAAMGNKPDLRDMLSTEIPGGDMS